MPMYVKNIYDKLDPDQELPFEVEDCEGYTIGFYLRFSDFMKIMKAFSDYKNSS